MPSIGRPDQGPSKFAGIKMADKKISSNSKRTNTADELNRLAGVKEESRFVDRDKHNKLGKDGFLKLLAHQMQNQDPMKPMDQKQFAADLAQFSQLEQMTNMNSKLDNFGKNAPQELKFYGASFLGKEIVTAGTTINYDGSARQTDIPFYLPKAAKNVIVNVFDSKKQLIAQVEREEMGQGPQSVLWNGRQLDGTRAVKDKYTFQVLAWDNQMSEFKGETKGTGVVSGVNFQDGETVLNLKDGRKIFLRDVDSFKLPKQTQEIHKQKNPALQKNAANAYNNIEQQQH